MTLLNRLVDRIAYLEDREAQAQVAHAKAVERRANAEQAKRRSEDALARAVALLQTTQVSPKDESRLAQELDALEQEIKRLEGFAS